MITRCVTNSHALVFIRGRFYQSRFRVVVRIGDISCLLYCLLQLMSRVFKDGQVQSESQPLAPQVALFLLERR
jgi:hypothetical protein